MDDVYRKAAEIIAREYVLPPEEVTVVHDGKGNIVGYIWTPPPPPNPCPYDQSHTREWCGYDQCRES